ncbi:hypothetical protein U0070_026979 [Myodes glareolus]|uniref:U1-C C2H2-type zinc finger domain-containing protein n=1 Tax=Myodes glareolus TaxID=447135 RepID=A0AAW0K1H0_MYOGA
MSTAEQTLEQLQLKSGATEPGSPQPAEQHDEVYCDYCNMYLSHGSPSVRKTLQWSETQRDREILLPEMEEQAKSLLDNTMAAFQQGKIPPAPFSAPPPARARIPPPPSYPGLPCLGMMPAPHVGGPPMMPVVGPLLLGGGLWDLLLE